MHRDFVTTYPSSVEPLATSPICETQGMYMANKLVTVEWHPDFSSEIMEALLKLRLERGIFDTATYEEAMSRCYDAHDGELVFKAFLKFLLQEKC
jgi:GMP synthase-like glutamine amidotransferase